MTAEQIADVVMTAVKVATAPLVDRMVLLEAKALIVGPQGEPGKDGDKGELGKTGLPGEPGPAGQDADPAVVLALKNDVSVLRSELLQTKSLDVTQAMVTQMVADAITALPWPKDGKDGADADPALVLALKYEIVALQSELLQTKSMHVTPAMVTQMVADALAAMPTPQDGKDGLGGKDGTSVDLVVVDALIRQKVEEAVSAIPIPKDGHSVTVDDVATIIQGLIEKAFSAITPPKDGLGIASAIVDRAGHLIVTMTDGAEKDLGEVVGRPGRDGLPGIGRPGADGKDGADGLSFDDIQVEYDGERTFIVKFVRGERVKSFPFTLPVTIYRGIYTEGKTYHVGDVVTCGGNSWYARKETTVKPDYVGQGPQSKDFWTLMVKRGNDGRDVSGSPSVPFPVVKVGKR